MLSSLFASVVLGFNIVYDMFVFACGILFIITERNNHDTMKTNTIFTIKTICVTKLVLPILSTSV